jgi:co-chaperonin GroES (HSP10)
MDIPAVYSIKQVDWTGVSLPQPALWRLLIEPIQVEEMTRGGIVLAPETQRAKEYLRYVGQVLALGDGAYQHPKFEGCRPDIKVGDWVVYQTYSGFDVRVLDATGQARTLRFINDDEVMAKAVDPHALLATV